MTAHWGLPDPAAVEGSRPEQLRAFRDTAAALRRRIGLFVNLPIQSLDRLKLQSELSAIGETPKEASDGSDRSTD
jgi:arsenate reductase